LRGEEEQEEGGPFLIFLFYFRSAARFYLGVAKINVFAPLQRQPKWTFFFLGFDCHQEGKASLCCFLILGFCGDF
jgi:hypothetical protein